MAVKKKTETEVKKVEYKVIETFKDSDGVVYSKGCKYPADKPKTRLNQLLTDKNKMNRPFIVEV